MVFAAAARWATLAFAALVLAACTSGGGAATTPPELAASSAAGSPVAATATPMPDAATAAPPVASSAPPADPPTASPAPNPAADALAGAPWATADLTDVTTGETFSIASLAGKPVFVEAMAIWCSNCRAQQGRFTEALSRLAPGTAEYVVLTVDPSESARELARYKEQRGFTGRYAVAGADVAKALKDAFGPNVLNPPSVPLVLVQPDGSVQFTTGPESVERILELAGA